MALEVSSSVSVEYDDDLQTGSLSVAARQVTSAGLRFTKLLQDVGITEEAVKLGEITAPGAFLLVNLDPTNYIEVKVGTAGAIFAKLKPDVNGDGNGGWVGGDCMGSGAQAPFVIADTAPCKLAVFIADA